MTVATGESTNIVQTRQNLESFQSTAATHLDTSASAASEAEELRTAAEQMGGDLAGVEMDQETQARVAQLREAADLHAQNAQALAASAEQVNAAAGAAMDAVNEHSGVEEAVKAKGEVAQTAFYQGG